MREEDEWEAGHAPGAVHIPLGELDLSALPRDTDVVVVCRSEGRSTKAAQKLASAGLAAFNMVGGMSAWSDGGLPVTRDDGTTGTIK